MTGKACDAAMPAKNARTTARKAIAEAKHVPATELSAAPQTPCVHDQTYVWAYKTSRFRDQTYVRAYNTSRFHDQTYVQAYRTSRFHVQTYVQAN